MLRCAPPFAAAASFALAAGIAAAAAASDTWSVDPVHSTAQFTITHLGITKVNGTIPIRTATVVTKAGETEPSSVVAVLDVAGIDTRNGMRDGDLRGDHWFDAATYPTITFTSTKVTRVDAKRFDVAGTFAMHGVTKPIVLHGTYLGRAAGMHGEPRIAYEAAGTIERGDFGMTGGGPVVGNDVALLLDVEATTAK